MSYNAEYHATYYRKHKEKILASRRADYARDPLREIAKNKAWRERNPHITYRHSLKSRLAKYGLTIAEYERRVLAQAGLCDICGKPDTRRLSVDHSHVTGVVRALLCRNCNAGLGHFMDDPRLLLSAAKYIKRWSRI